MQAVLDRYKARRGKALTLTTAVGDTLADRLFPHQLIPHYVWITPSGRVLATTSSGEVTAAAVRNVLDGLPPAFVLKKDQDTGRPLFSGGDLPAAGLRHYAVLVKGWFEGLPGGGRAREKDGVVYGWALSNTALLDMYKTVARMLDPTLTDRQVILSVADSASLVPPLSGSEREAWFRKNAFTLDLIVPQQEAARLASNMLEILNRYSGYTGRLEERTLRCWVLVKKNPAVAFRSKGGKTVNRLGDKDRPLLRNGKMAMLVNYLNNQPAIKGLVRDETGYAGQLDLALKGGLSGLKAIRENLAENGLVLKRAERRVKLLVIHQGPTAKDEPPAKAE